VRLIKKLCSPPGAFIPYIYPHTNIFQRFFLKLIDTEVLRVVKSDFLFKNIFIAFHMAEDFRKCCLSQNDVFIAGIKFLCTIAVCSFFSPVLQIV
jgi:hypothetical protein